MSMKFYVNLKKAGSRRFALEKVPYETERSLAVLRDLLAFLVHTEVERFNARTEEGDVLRYLCEADVEAQAQTGKVGFDAIYREDLADEDRALKTALEAFNDGLVRVFQNETELTELEQPLNLQEEDVVTILRLTFLSGRLW
jgi:hypothetical protein